MTAELGSFYPPVRVIKPGLDGGSGEDRKVFVVAFDPGGTTGWCVMRINLEHLRSYGLRGVALAHPDPAVFSFTTGTFTGPVPYQAEQMMALLRGTWMHGEGVWDEGPESDLFVATIEHFTLRVFSTDADLLLPVRVTAAFWSLAWRSLYIPVTAYQPSDAMKVFPDSVLRALNLWAGVDGKNGEHERDATRHAGLVARRFVDPHWVEEISRKMPWLKR